MKFFDTLLELLYPTKCAFCHKLIVKTGEKVCPECRKNLPYTPPGAQIQSFPHIKKCAAPLYYKDYVRDSLLRYKFSSLSSYCDVYAAFLTKCIDENEVFCDIITWVPLSRRRRRQRGYDQSQLIASALADNLGIPCVQLLKKIRNTPKQSKISKPAQRRANVAGVYAAVNTELLRGKRLLIVDDIVTTGATLSECALTLKNAGAAVVNAAAVARASD